MAIADTNSIIRAHLVTCGTLTFYLTNPDGTWRIYCPRLPEDCTWPVGEGALSFFTRGGGSTPYIPGIPGPSVQFDCWASDPITARTIYNKLYDNLQGIQHTAVGAYTILSAIEEVQGQDLVDAEIPNYFRVLTFFSIMVRAE